MSRWFFAIVVIVIAALFADRAPRWFRSLLLFVTTVLLGFTLAEIGSGAIRLQFTDESRFHEFHRWTAHGIVIAHWTLMFVGVGASIAAAARQRWLVAALILTLPVVAAVISLMASFTGYLHPRNMEAAHELQRIVNEENRNRFVVLHAIVLPTALIGCQVAMTAVLWRLPKRVDVSPPQAPSDEPS